MNLSSPPNVTEDVVHRVDWNRWLMALALVKVGQDLGSESTLARSVHDLISVVLSLALK
jgi:hypothetical protein